MLRSVLSATPRWVASPWARPAKRLGRVDEFAGLHCRHAAPDQASTRRRWLYHRSGAAISQQLKLRWAGAVSQLVELANEHQGRLQQDALPADPWEDGARAVQLGEALELLRELVQCDDPGKVHEQHVLSDISWALASLGTYDAVLLQWLQYHALATAESMSGNSLARIAWAMGHLNAEASEQLLHALGQRAETLLLSSQSRLKSTHVSQLAWACAVRNVSSSALQPVVLAAKAGAWDNLSTYTNEGVAAHPKRTLDDLRRLHPFLLDLQLQNHPAVVDRDGALAKLCAMSRREFVRSSFMFAQQRPSSFQVRSNVEFRSGCLRCSGAACTQLRFQSDWLSGATWWLSVSLCAAARCR